MSWEAATRGRFAHDRPLAHRSRGAVAAPHRDRRPRRHDRLRHPRRVAPTELAEGLRAGGLRRRATASRRSRATPATTSSRSSPARWPASRSCRCRGGCTPRELADVLRRSDPALVLDRRRVRIARGRGAAAGSTSCRRSRRSARPGSRHPFPPARDPRPVRHVRDDDPLLVIFTSGSEAAPKGVVLTHANCFWNNLALAQALPLTHDDVVLAMLPQFHVAGWNCQPLLAWWVGATVVLERSFQPARALQLIRERRVTAMMGVPTQYAMLAADRDWRRDRRVVASGSRSSAGRRCPALLQAAVGRRAGCRSPRATGSPRPHRTCCTCRAEDAAAHVGRRRAAVPARQRARRRPGHAAAARG